MKNIMETLRPRVSAASLRFVGTPYLPSGLIGLALLLAYTDLMLILLGQSAAYWIDKSRAVSSLPMLEGILSAGPLAFILTGLFYLLLIWFALTIFTRSIALTLWMPITFVHLTHILFWSIEKVVPFGSVPLSQALIAFVNLSSALILGIALIRLLIHPPSSIKATTRFKVLVKSIALTLWVLALLAGVAFAAFRPRSGWVRLQPEHTPGQRGNTAVAYDSLRQRTVLFGGLSDWLGSKFLYENDTWEWDGKDWIEMHPQTIPPARINQMMAFDEKRGVVVMFGGEEHTGNYALSDTWEWDGTDWKQIFPDYYPPARRGGQLFYDPNSEKIILSGGFYYAAPDKVFTTVNDAWAWDGKDWQYITTLTDSLRITNPNTVYDPTQGHTILFNFNQLMYWTEDGQWTEIVMEQKPLPRFGTSLAINPENGNMLIFGGLDKVQLNDTWQMKGNTWTELQPDLTPSPRDAHVMFYDPIRKSYILYGGVSTYALDDMWEFVVP